MGFCGMGFCGMGFCGMGFCGMGFQPVPTVWTRLHVKPIGNGHRLTPRQIAQIRYARRHHPPVTLSTGQAPLQPQHPRRQALGPQRVRQGTLVRHPDRVTLGRPPDPKPTQPLGQRRPVGHRRVRYRARCLTPDAAQPLFKPHDPPPHRHRTTLPTAQARAASPPAA